ncbi:FeoB-associated Cys-rich membrane protein [Chitinophaga rhizophila]|uniref:FeoB-associated Cys-rich membrane protein n=1 Tax=Chitinophaga rhizophila TaxID=2866212 RepID=A0ABS7GEJ2_9BACT|nr:FeoB-associated Cys-rich membrane protein [Chitinophaga rhizophila]MBW8684943.1 FeoB-associated Cys-rich membrane protein [Chitinophaga rhizophila]
MENVNILQIVIVLFIALAIVVFVVIRNKKDRKKLLKNDPVEGKIAEQHRNRDRR